MLALAWSLAEVRHDFLEEWRPERESESKLRIPSVWKELRIGEVSVLPLELGLSAITLAIVARLAFTKKSGPACITFDS